MSNFITIISGYCKNYWNRSRIERVTVIYSATFYRTQPKCTICYIYPSSYVHTHIWGYV